MENDNYQPIVCNEKGCNGVATHICLCSNTIFYLCRSHCVEHMDRFSERSHELMQIIPTNPNVLERLIDRLYLVIEETDTQMEICNIKMNKLIDFYEKLLKKISHTKKMLLNELQATINTCKNLINKVQKPIFKKIYYNQLEFLLISNDFSYYDDVISQILPPKLKIIKLDQNNMWEKISFYSATFSHLLSDYNNYCFDIEKISEFEFKLVYFDGIKEEKYFHPSIEPASRMMLISPNDILITGGLINPKKSHIFNIKDKQLFPQNDINHERYWHCCTFIKGFPTIIGGTFSKCPIKTVESLKYDKWCDITPLNYPRSSASVSACFEKVYVVGGNDRHFCEVFDDATNEWEELIWHMPFYPRISPGLICICEDFILIFGGNLFPDIALTESVKVDAKNSETSNILPLEIKGKFSYGSHIIKDGIFCSSYNNSFGSQFLKWELKEEIDFISC